MADLLIKTSNSELVLATIGGDRIDGAGGNDTIYGGATATDAGEGDDEL